MKNVWCYYIQILQLFSILNTFSLYVYFYKQIFHMVLYPSDFVSFNFIYQNENIVKNLIMYLLYL